MKTIRISVTGWARPLFVMTACGVLALTGATAQTQNSLNFRHTDQQPSPTASSADVQMTTPELQADMLEAHGEYQAAINAYRGIDPPTAEIYNKLGIAYQRLGNDNQAIANYNLATKLNHKFATAYNNMGTVYFQEKDNKRASKLYKHSIRLDGERAPYWSNLGAVYLSDRKYSDGVEAYEKAFKLDPNIFDEIALNGIQKFESPEELAQMYITFAEIYAHAGMKIQAIVYLKKAIDEGFDDRHKLQQDQQLATLHGDPAFELLVTGRSKM